jgi:diguanylate cyclase (GGDEF)-like protein
VKRSTARTVDIVDATRGPLVGEGRLNRIMPFAGTAAISALVAVPATSWTRPGLAVAGLALAAATIVGSLVIPWHRMKRAVQLGSPLLFLVATLLLTAASGQCAGSPFVTLVVLPLMWLALYENRAAVVLAAMLAGSALWLAVPARTTALHDDRMASISVLVIVGAGMAATLNGLVANARRLALALRENQRALEHLSLHDSLTDLSNRRGFAAESRLAIDRARHDGLPFSLVYIDLDNFKGLNDTLGHDVGDRLLKEVADRLRLLVRAADTVARLGGDEFAVIVEGSNPAQATRLAERIERELGLPYAAAPGVSFSASVGIAHSVGAGTDLEAVLSAADISMFEHKREGNRRRRAGAGRGAPPIRPTIASGG